MALSADNKRFVWIAVIYTLLVMALCFISSALFVTCNSREEVKEKVTHKTDTVVVRKTDKVYVDRVKWLPGRIDTVFVFNGTDSLLLSGYAKDTVFIECLELKYITRDTVIHDTVIVERTIDKPLRHYGVGVMAGMSAIYGITTRRFDVGPGIMVGFTYKF